MPRRLIFAFPLLASLLPGAIWPEQLWEHKRTAIKAVTLAPADKGLWDEYGLEAAEEAERAARSDS